MVKMAVDEGPKVIEWLINVTAHHFLSLFFLKAVPFAALGTWHNLFIVGDNPPIINNDIYDQELSATVRSS